MPALIQNHKKQEASARLKKFYSMMSQAILLSENAQGAKVWEWSGLLDRPYEEDDSQQMFDDSYAYWNKYLAPYIKTVKVEKGVYDEENSENSTATKVYFSDGSTATLKIGRCMDVYYDINGERGPNVRGKDIFTFFIATPRTFALDRPTQTHELKLWHSFDVPYLPVLYNTRVKALQGCKNEPQYCTTLLMYDNWDFKSDYPYKL